MRYRVELSQLAIDDLDALHLWIERQGGVDVANAYRKRIYASMETLSQFPRRGTIRTDLGLDVRSIGFERT